MALNWAMISDDGSKPVPLPGEKIFYSTEKCNMSLTFPNQSKKWSANGTAFVTSQRVLFLRQPPLPAPVDPSVSSEHLRTLSVPLSQFIETRYMIPIFSAPHYEAGIVPSPDGGLPPREAGHGSNVGILKIWFNEGGGMTFRDSVEEVKSRRDEGASNVEALPLYEANTAHGTGSMSGPFSSQGNLLPPRRPTRTDSLPHHDDMLAAQVAREHEEQERDEQRNSARQNAPPPNTSAEMPPAYQE